MYARHKWIRAAVVVIAAGWFASATAQCVDSADGRTALRFDNESSYEVTFYIDDTKIATMAPKTTSGEFYVVPGGHFLSASAATADGELWVFSLNVVPKGQVCTWHVTDPGDTENMLDRRGATLSTGDVY
jgi:hypothetical protein